MYAQLNFYFCMANLKNNLRCLSLELQEELEVEKPL
jgi:hypothetical protein